MPPRSGILATSFEERIRVSRRHGSRRSRSSSYETRGRLQPEPESDVRTPFQRDRDRIVHSKPFRRLKGKTQVFIDPAGDHYRTRMTHTLETTGIARVVARALRLNEDLVEAIGLGHDTGHTPFGHAGEEALDAALRDRFGGRFRHNEQSLRIAETPQPDARGPRRDPHAHGRRRSRRRSRARSSASSTASPTSTTTSTTRSATASSATATCRGPRSRCSAPPASRRIDTLVHDLIETSAREGDIVQSDEVGGAMLSLRTFMFERVYLGPEAAVEHERARAVVHRIFDHLADRGDDPGRDHPVHRRHDRPLRPRLRCPARLMARLKDSTVEAVKQRADLVAVVEERTPLRKAGSPPRGPLPVPRGAHAELQRQRRTGALPLLRLRQGRRHDPVRAGHAGPRLHRRGGLAGGALRHHDRSTRTPRRPRTRAGSAGSACWPSSTRRPRSTSAISGTRRPARSRATTSPAAASARRSAGSSASASRSEVRRSRARPARRATRRRSSSRPA